MLTIILKNWKGVAGLITALAVPMVMSSFGFIMTTSKTNATMPMIEARVQSLEQINYRMDERYKFIKETLLKIEANQKK